MNEQIKGKHDIFISYSTKNKNVADAIVADFEHNGIKCWYAPRDILPGEEWVTAITNALESSKALVLIYTDESNNSRQVMNEIAVAFNAGLTIVPFRLSNEEMSSELEYYLTRVHWLDAVTKPLKENIEALREYIRVIIKTPNAIKSGHMEKSRKQVKKPVVGIIAGILIVIAVLVIGVILGISYGTKSTNGDTTQEAEEEKEKNKKDNDDEDDVEEEDDDEAPVDENKGAEYYSIGDAYLLNEDYENAFEYFEKAEAEGSREAMIALGNMYFDDLYVDMSEETAMDYYLKASGYSKEGDRFVLDPDGVTTEEMLNRMGLIFFYNGSYDEAAFFFEEDVRIYDSVTAMGNAAMAYDYGENWAKALAMYGSAIDAGHRDSNKYKERIAEMVDDGLVSSSDAEEWLD